MENEMQNNVPEPWTEHTTPPFFVYVAESNGVFP
jgi:hypothetical protein